MQGLFPDDDDAGMWARYFGRKMPDTKLRYFLGEIKLLLLVQVLKIQDTFLKK